MSAKELEKTQESPSTARARKISTVRHPLSLRLPPNLEEELRREASKTSISLRDYIRALLEQRKKATVSVETIGAGYIKALSEKIAEVTSEPLIALEETILAEIHKIQPQPDSKACDYISQRICNAVQQHFDHSREEAKKRAEELRERLLDAAYVTRLSRVKAALILSASVILCSVAVCTTAICLIHDVYPWEVSQIRERAARGYVLDQVFGSLPQEVREGIIQFNATGKYPSAKEGKR